MLPSRVVRQASAVVIAVALLYTTWKFQNRNLTIEKIRILAGQTASSFTNTSLGFEKVVVISTGSSTRLNGLYEAASLTGIDVEVPWQPKWVMDEIDDFRGIGIPGRNSKIGPGQTNCWLGHLNALRRMVDEDWSTALIMEDDVDWDIAIKHQLELVSPLIRKVTGSRILDPYNGHDSPYGDAWDLLWVGHCGDNIPSKNILRIHDETLPDSSDYVERSGAITKFPHKIRMVHKSVGPICTYAYAVTKYAAKEIWDKYHRGSDHLITDGIKEMCQSGELRCVTVNPELFHHHKEAGTVSSEIAVLEGKGWEDLAEVDTVSYTLNIRYSARCNSGSEVLKTCQSQFGDELR